MKLTKQELNDLLEKGIKELEDCRKELDEAQSLLNKYKAMGSIDELEVMIGNTKNLVSNHYLLDKDLKEYQKIGTPDDIINIIKNYDFTKKQLENSENEVNVLHEEIHLLNTEIEKQLSLEKRSVMVKQLIDIARELI